MKKSKLLALLLPVQILLVNLLAFFPEFIEKFYSNGLYPLLSKSERVFFGWCGFSIGDIIYGIVIIFALRWLWQRRKTWKLQWKQNLVGIAAFVSVIYFLFNFLWGLNYHRVPLYKKMAIEKDYTPEELVAFTRRLIDKTNALHYQITKNDSAKVVMPYGADEIYNRSLNGYTNLDKTFNEFNYSHKSIKSSLISTPLSYMGFGGYLNPFTNEAQVNNKLPLYNLPTTTCHEMSHQIGYASESEANFIGYIASINNDDIYFKYSGYSFALKYCLRNIYKIDKAKAKSLMPLIHAGIRKNFKESDDFGKKYESFVEDFFKYFYDNFLKLNHQEDGLETYSKFVGLMVNYYEHKNL